MPKPRLIPLTDYDYLSGARVRHNDGEVWDSTRRVDLQHRSRQRNLYPISFWAEDPPGALGLNTWVTVWFQKPARVLYPHSLSLKMLNPAFPNPGDEFEWRWHMADSPAAPLLSGKLIFAQTCSDVAATHYSSAAPLVASVPPEKYLTCSVIRRGGGTATGVFFMTLWVKEDLDG